MNSQPEQDLDERFQQLEAELNSPSPPPPAISQPEKPLQPQTASESFSLPQLEQFTNWFNSLSGLGKLIVIGIAAMVGLVILRAVLKLVAAVISLAVLAVLLYFAYQFFMTRSTETKD